MNFHITSFQALPTVENEEVQSSEENILSRDEFDLINELLRNDSDQKYQDLDTLIKSEDFLSTINVKVNKSPGEILLMLLKFSIANKLPLTSISNLAALLNNVFVTNILPESRYMLDKLLNTKDNCEYHAVCLNCDIYIGQLQDLNDSVKCSVCGIVMDLSKPSCLNFFVIINPCQTIANYLTAYADHYSYVVNERIHVKGEMKDVYDGRLYQKFLKKLPPSERHRYVTAVFNTDGAPRFESSNFSIWPMYLMINELPPEKRYDSVVPCGLWFGKKKPEMRVFLKIFVDMIHKINETGFECKIKEKMMSLMLYVLEACVDTIARAPMQGIKQFNGFYGCNWCLIRGIWLDGSLRYVIDKDTVIELRDHDTTVAQMYAVCESKLPIYGVKYPSALINLDHFDIISGFVPDYMHQYLIGVAKQMTELYLHGLCSTIMDSLDSYLLAFKAPTQIGRASEKLSNRGQWNAKLWENWVLYYSIPILELILEKDKLRHWCLLVESLHILLQTDLTFADIDKADEMLHDFVFGVQDLYSKTDMTFNVHQCLHIARSVANWGPLWAHCTFAFENANRLLLKAIHCSKGVNQQIVRYINMQHSVQILEEAITPHSSETVSKYCKNLSKTEVKKTIKLSDVRYFGNEKSISEEILEAVGLQSQKFHVYHRIVKDSCAYKTCTKVNERSCDSYAKLEDNSFIKCIAFIINTKTKEELTLCNTIGVTSMEYCRYLYKVNYVSCEVRAIPTANINRICLFMPVKKKSFISAVPNSFHY